MSDVAIAERGRIFFDENGVLRFWNKNHLHNLPETSISLTKENDIKDINYQVAENAIKNRCLVTAKPRASAGVQVIWTNGNIEALDPYTDTLVYIPANGTQDAFIERRSL